MSKFSFAWELGSGLGHVVRLAPIAEQLLSRGHQNLASVKDLRLAGKVLPSSVRLFQAPILQRSTHRLPKILTFSHVLHNVGFADQAGLQCCADAWREMFKVLKPDLLLADHSPTAILAARGLNFQSAIIGTGFSCPQSSTPMKTLREAAVSTEALLAHEDQLTSVLNKVLQNWSAPTLECVGDLYRDPNAEFLATYPELDPYVPRSATRYHGTWAPRDGVKEPWPSGTGPRVFAYLKPFTGIEQLLDALNSRGWPTLIVGGGLASQESHHRRTVRILTQPLDMQYACSTCDFAILNATHGSTAAVLLAGKPVVLMPLFLEQALTAKRVVEMGAGCIAPINQPQMFLNALDQVVNSSYQSAARAFAQRYSHLNPDQSVDEIVTQLECLATAVGQ
jgi:UDP:flavonoid glycosyltransferase YjiC (YdhE family)